MIANMRTTYVAAARATSLHVAPRANATTVPMWIATIPAMLKSFPKSRLVGGVARTVADKNVTINNILPGAFDTDRLRGTLSKMAEQKGKSIGEVAAERIAGISARRFGNPDEFGAACAFLCSTHAGYITGQNLLIDGGTFNGAF